MNEEKQMGEALEKMLGSVPSETSCFEMSIDFRQLRAVYVCGAGEAFNSCKCFSPNLLGGCSHLTLNGICLNTEIPLH